MQTSSIISKILIISTCACVWYMAKFRILPLHYKKLVILLAWPAQCFIVSGCPKMDLSESGCSFIEGYILYNMIKQDEVGVWTPKTPHDGAGPD